MKMASLPISNIVLFHILKIMGALLKSNKRFFETIQNLYIKGKIAGKPLTKKLTISPNEKKIKVLARGQIIGGVQN